MSHLLHVTTIYKIGHAQPKTACAIIGRNINRIERTPMEVPDYTDGVTARIGLANGEFVAVTDDFDDLIKRWEAVLESL